MSVDADEAGEPQTRDGGSSWRSDGTAGSSSDGDAAPRGLPPACAALAHCCLVVPALASVEEMCYLDAIDGYFSATQCAQGVALYADGGECVGVVGR